MSVAQLPKGMLFVGQFGGVRNVTKADGEVVQGLKRITVVVPGTGEDAEDERFDCSYFETSVGRELSRMAKLIADLRLEEGEPVAVRVRMRQSQSGSGRTFTNFDAVRVVRLTDVAGATGSPARRVG